MELILDILLDSLMDVLRILPFLFLTYLFMEWMEHQAGGKMEAFLERHTHFGPLLGALFGVIPECGFSSASSSLYATHVISAGTLIAVYLSTSDEMLPILISQKAGWNAIAPILLVKIVVSLIAGYIADAFSIHARTDIESFCRREHCSCDEEEEGSILHSALNHTIKITIWLFAVTFVINLLMTVVGMEAMRNLITNHPTSALLTSSLLGMIPSCASSILLTQLYVEHVIDFAAVCAGLLANAGVGMMVLFRVNPDIKNNLRIIGYVFATAMITGLILQFFI